MSFKTFLRHVREGFRNVFRNGWMSVASITSIVVSLLVLGVFILLVLNVNSLADKADSQVQITVHLTLETNQALRDTLQNEIGSMPEVSKIEFISKEQGLENLRKDLGPDADSILEGFDKDNNPLNDAFQVEVVEPTTVPFVAKKIEALNDTHPEKPIYKVKYGQGAIETLFKVTKTIRNIGFVFVAGLAIMSMFLISNTIRVTILARRKEIGIMKLVGATNAFIRWPFFVEGALIGLIGSVITVGILYAGYSGLSSSIVGDPLMGGSLIPFQNIWVLLSGLIVGLGVLIGIWGSVVSIRKSLKV
ncbi:permease-like cell division protein FtsX [Paenibacillus sp. HN-1]|uniref:permease-like cell division protein FtsX n=1 Tax=Paenibacillus TaxID=44249 RepID=UPI001CA86D75|nr:MULTISPECIES: permease-like cell division protein FtsX [Paenibacillus]MBY9077560.1 permease-like cell division protein FtsX [Paenibacillus sp. CGMCC 1.18879]MBY9087831.1 permease-like cell division protein FtsX [Paenibacillus sinensis]